MALLRQFASTVGDGTGTVTGASDSSSVAVKLKVSPAAGQTYKIDRIIVLVEDNAALKYDTFGTAALTNGIRIQVLDDDDVSLLNIDAGAPIKRLGDLAGLGGEQIVDSTQAAAGTNKFAVFILRFPDGITLNGDTPSRLEVKFNDDLSNLVLVKVLALGTKRGQLTA